MANWWDDMLEPRPAPAQPAQPQPLGGLPRPTPGGLPLPTLPTFDELRQQRGIASDEEIARSLRQPLPVAPPATLPVQRPAFDLSNVGSALWEGATEQLLPSLKSAAAQAYTGINPVEPDSTAARWMEEGRQSQARADTRLEALRQSGQTDSTSEAIRQAIPSLGFSGLSMLGSLPAGIATGVATASPVAGALAAGAVGGALGYRMAGSQLLNDSLAEMETESQKQRGQPLTAEERQRAVDALTPIAQNTGLWEAGPEAVGNALMFGLGRVALGFMPKEAMTRLASGALGRAGVRTAAGAGALGGEVATEGVTQFNQGPDQQRAQAATQALLSGTDPQRAIEGVIPQYQGAEGLWQATKDIAPATIATVLMMGGIAKPIGMAYSAVQQRREGTARADDATRATADLRANLDFAREQDIVQALAGFDTVEAQGKLPKAAAERLAAARQQLADELALRASPDALAEPMDNARGAAGYLGFSARAHELNDDQIAELAQRPIPDDAPPEFKAARDAYGLEAKRRQSLNEAVQHFEQNPEAVAGIAKIISDIGAGKPMAKGAHGSTDYNLASLSDDLLTKYRMAGEVLLRDHADTLGKGKSSVESALTLLHAESDRRAAGERRDPQAIREADIAQRIAKGAKGTDKLLAGLSPEAMERMADGLDARAALEPALAATAAQIRQRAQAEREQQAAAQPAPPAAQPPAARPVPTPASATPVTPVAPVTPRQQQQAARQQEVAAINQQLPVAPAAPVQALPVPPVPPVTPAVPPVTQPVTPGVSPVTPAPAPAATLPNPTWGMGQPGFTEQPGQQPPVVGPGFAPPSSLPAPRRQPGLPNAQPTAAPQAEATPPVGIPAGPESARPGRSGTTGTTAGTAGEKQPWEMTYDEVRDALSIGTKAELQRAIPLLKALYPEQLLETNIHDPWGIKRAVERNDEYPRVPTVELSQRHKRVIKAAIAEGHSIPAEVLADYEEFANLARGETTPTAADQPTPAPTPASSIPPAVLSTVELALQKLARLSAQLDGVRKARGDGAILAMERESLVPEIDKAFRTLENFRTLAQKKGIDADAAIADMGIEFDRELLRPSIPTVPSTQPEPANAQERQATSEALLKQEPTTTEAVPAASNFPDLNQAQAAIAQREFEIAQQPRPDHAARVESWKDRLKGQEKLTEAQLKQQVARKEPVMLAALKKAAASFGIARARLDALETRGVSVSAARTHEEKTRAVLTTLTEEFHDDRAWAEAALSRVKQEPPASQGAVQPAAPKPAKPTLPAKPQPAPKAAPSWNDATPSEREALLQAAGLSAEFAARKAKEWTTWAAIPEGPTKKRIRDAIAGQVEPKAPAPAVKAPEAPPAPQKADAVTAQQKAAIKVIYEQYQGDAWGLAGPHNKDARRELHQKLLDGTGKKATIANSGVTAIRERLLELSGISQQGKAIVTWERELTEWMKSVVAPAPQAAKPEPKVRKPRDTGVDLARDSLLVAIAKLGGLQRVESERQGIDPANFGTRPIFGAPVFRATDGLSFDAMAEALDELGYPVRDERGHYSPNVLLDAIQRELAGNLVYTPEGMEAAAQRDKEDRAKLDVENKAWQLEPEDFETSGFDTLSNHEQATAKLQAEANLDLGEDMADAIFERVSQQNPAVPQEQFNDLLRTAFDEARQRKSADRRQPAGESAPQPESGAPESPFLQSYSAADQRAREERLKQAEAAKLAQERAADQKAAADTQAKDFVLSGSNRPADQAMARGQTNMLDVMDGKAPAQAPRGEQPAQQDKPGQRFSRPKSPKSITIDGVELPLNDDGTVTLYHHTSQELADKIRKTGILKSAGEPDVYLSTEQSPTTGYGDTVVALRVDPKRLRIDDEFPNGRVDFRMDTGKPGGSVRVAVAESPSRRSAPTTTAQPANKRPLTKGDRVKIAENATGLFSADRDLDAGAYGTIIGKWSKNSSSVRLEDGRERTFLNDYLIQQENPRTKFVQISESENRDRVQSYVKDNQEELDALEWRYAEPGEVFNRVVWEPIGNKTLEPNPMDSVGLKSSKNVSALHVSNEPENWAVVLREDYGREGRYRIATILAMPGDIVVDDPQQTMPTEQFDRMLDSHILITGRELLKRNLEKLYFSKTSTPSLSSTIPQARANLVQAMGERNVAALERSGRLRFHATDPTGTGAAGYVDSKGVTHLIPSNMDSSALSVALHEGMHLARDDRFTDGERAKVQLAHAVLRLVGLKNFIGQPGHADIVKQVHRMAAEGHKAAIDAIRKARLEGRADSRVDVDEEIVSYLAQYGDERLPLVRRILAAIRAALYRMGIKVKLTPADVRALALSALKAQARAANRELMSARRDTAAPAFSLPEFAPTAADKAEVERQMAAVKEVRNAQGRLLAPNGKVSNLNERQWKQVRTKFFMDWFGNWMTDPENASQVVDENGEPSDAEYLAAVDRSQPDIRYSRPGRPPRLDSPRMAAQVLDDIGGLRSALKPGERLLAKANPANWRQMLSDLKANLRPQWLGLLTQDMQLELAKAQLPANLVRDFDTASEKMDAYESKMIQTEAFPIAERWQNLLLRNRSQADAASRALYLSTWLRVDPRQPAPNGKQVQWLRAKAALDALTTPEARQLYDDVLAFYESQTTRLFDELAARIQRHSLPEPDKLAARDLLRQEFERMRQEGPYAPLMRFGDLTVYAEPRTPTEKPVFATFENVAEQRAFADWLTGEGYSPQVGVQMEEVAKRALPPGDFVGKLADIIDATAKGPEAQILKDAMHQLFLRSLPEQAIRKHFIHRKFIPGYSADALRTFAAFSRRSSKQIARLAHSDQMSGALDAMAAAVRHGEVADPVAAGHLVNELDKSYQWAMNPSTATWSSRLTHLGFMWHLGASPAHLLLNLSQQAQVTLPWLAGELTGKKSFGAVAAAMLKANKDFITSNPFVSPDKLGDRAARQRAAIENEFNGDLGRALRALEEAGKTDKTQTYTTAGLSEEDSFLWTKPYTRKLTQGAAWFFHIAEVINREASAIAAYRMGRQSGMSHEQATVLARRAINETHWDYSPQNRARFMRGNVAKVLTLFKQYSLNLTWQLGRNAYLSAKGASPQEKAVARTKLLGMLGMTGVMAGAVGLPFFDEAMWMLTQLMAATADDDEPELDAETRLRALLDDAFNPTASAAMRRGLVNAFVGIDLSSRVKFDDLWWRDLKDDLHGKQVAYAALEQALGPVAGLAVRAMTTVDGLLEAMIDGGNARGASWRTLEGAMPKVLKDISKGLRFATEGATTASGAQLLTPEQLGPAATVGQVLGFTPAELTERFAENAARMKLQDRIQRRHAALLNAFAMAYRQNDDEVLDELKQDIRAFNTRYPEMAITSATINRSLQSRARREAEIEAFGGVPLNRKLAARLMESGR